MSERSIEGSVKVSERSVEGSKVSLGSEVKVRSVGRV